MIDIGNALKIAVVSHLESFAPLTAIVPVEQMYGIQPPANPKFPCIRYGSPITGGFSAVCWEGSEVRVTLHAFAESGRNGAAEDVVQDIASLIVEAMGSFDPTNLNLIDCEFEQSRIMPDGNEADRFHAVVEFRIIAQPL